MRNAILHMSLIVLSLMLINMGHAKIDPKTAVGIWLLDEGSGRIVKDSSGNGHDGEIDGNVEWVKGKFGDALEFPGSGAVVIQPDLGLNITTFTIVTWYKGKPTGAKWQALVGKQKLEPDRTRRNYGLLYRNETGSLRTEFTVGESQWKAANGKTNIGDDNWHHLAGTFDGKTIKSWVDGEVDGELAESGKPDVHDEILLIGTYRGNVTSGVIDDVGIFSVALEQEDIKKIMVEGLSESLLTAVSPQDSLANTWGQIKTSG